MTARAAHPAAMPVVDRAFAIDLVTRLMAIPGPSGQEREVMRFIAGCLRRAGCPASAIRHDRAHERSPHGGQVGNLIVRLAGSIRAPRRLLVAHTDTVALCVGAQPRRRGEMICSAVTDRGVGADNRAGVAIVLSAAMTLLERRLPHPPLTLLFTVQEEVGVVGARHLTATAMGRPAMGFNFDGSGTDNLFLGAIGSTQLRVVVHGVAAHAGMAPWQGVNAITVAGRAIESLRRGGWLGAVRKQAGRGSVNLGTIRGGIARNVVAPEAELILGVRSHCPGFRRTIVEQIRGAFRRAAATTRNAAGLAASVEFHEALDYEAFRLPAHDPVVKAALAAARRAGGHKQQRVVLDGGLDANWLTHHGVPTVTLSTGAADGHTVHDSLNLPAFVQRCDLALLLANGA